MGRREDMYRRADALAKWFGWDPESVMVDNDGLYLTDRQVKELFEELGL